MIWIVFISCGVFGYLRWPVYSPAIVAFAVAAFLWWRLDPHFDHIRGTSLAILVLILSLIFGYIAFFIGRQIAKRTGGERPPAATIPDMTARTVVIAFIWLAVLCGLYLVGALLFWTYVPSARPPG